MSLQRMGWPRSGAIPVDNVEIFHADFPRRSSMRNWKARVTYFYNCDTIELLRMHVSLNKRAMGRGPS